MSPIPVKAVLSDAGGILFDDTHGGRVIYPAIAEMLGMPLQEMKDQYRPFAQRVMVDPDYTRSNSLQDFLKAIGKTADTDKILALYKKHWPVLTVFEGVSETVAELGNRNIDFIILTDAASTAAHLESRLRNTFGINNGLTGVLSSKDLRVMKPDKHFFDTALQKYGLQKEEVVFVAHDYDELKGAHDLGYTVLALNQNEDEGDFSFIPPERKMQVFSDVLKKVAYKP